MLRNPKPKPYKPKPARIQGFDFSQVHGGSGYLGAIRFAEGVVMFPTTLLGLYCDCACRYIARQTGYPGYTVLR